MPVKWELLNVGILAPVSGVYQVHHRLAISDNVTKYVQLVTTVRCSEMITPFSVISYYLTVFHEVPFVANGARLTF